MFNDRINILFNRFKSSVSSVDVYFKKSRETIITLINDDEISTEFDKEIKYFWTESTTHFVKNINTIVHQEILKMTIFYIQATVIIDIKFELNHHFSDEKDENFDELIYNVWKTVIVSLESDRNIFSKNV